MYTKRVNMVNILKVNSQKMKKNTFIFEPFQRMISKKLFMKYYKYIENIVS